MSDGFAIRTTGLCKRYGDVQALTDVDLQVPTGAVCALIGRNGAGKTTLIRSLLGMIHPTAGTGVVLGNSITGDRSSIEIRRRVAYVDPTALYPWMTVREILDFARRCYPDWNRAREIAGHFALDLPGTRKISELSKGMRTKLALLLSLARDAELLLFDEPTDGLDPIVREQILQAFVSVNATRRVTLLISSHQLAELEDIANWLCLLDRGRLVLSGEMSHLRAMHQRIDFAARPIVQSQTLPSAVVRLTSDGGFGTMIVSGPADDALRFLGATPVQCRPASLKEIVLAYAAADTGNVEWVNFGSSGDVA
jgi:ABC-type multidrug transport system ATPase subunit